MSELADAVFTFFLDLPEQLDGVRMVLRSLAPLTRDAKSPVELNGVVTRVPIIGDQYRRGWVESSADKERAQRLDRYFTEPGPSPAYSVDRISVFALHHEPGLVDREYLVLDDIETDEAIVSPLGWDYARLAAAAINDGAVVGRAVAVLKERNDQRSWEVAAMLTAIPSCVRGQGWVRKFRSVPANHRRVR